MSLISFRIAYSYRPIRLVGAHGGLFLGEVIYACLGQPTERLFLNADGAPSTSTLIALPMFPDKQGDGIPRLG
jgi:hypothetical protein